MSTVDHPKHYNMGGIECIDAMEAATEGLVGYEAISTAQAIKYIWRWKYKNGVEDIDKAIWYLERLKKKIAEKSMSEKEYVDGDKYDIQAEGRG